MQCLGGVRSLKKVGTRAKVRHFPLKIIKIGLTMIGEACCKICGVFSVKATEHSPGDVQDPSGSTQALASGDSVCLCVSGVRALRHPRQVCMFVCIENRGYRLWRRGGQLGRTRGVQNVSISFASREHKFEICKLMKVNFL